MKKRLITLVMTLALLLSALPITATAASTPQIQPRWTNTLALYMNITFSNSTGYVTVSLDGHNGVSNITAEIKLYYKNSRDNWIYTHNSWTYDVDQMYLTISEPFNTVSGREYMATINATVYKDGYGEVITDYVTATCPSN